MKSLVGLMSKEILQRYTRIPIGAKRIAVEVLKNEKDGGLDRTRICDLLRVKQAL